MRKKVFGRQLKRDRSSRSALFRGLVKSLIEYEKISTTETRVKAILPDIDHLVNLAKEKSTASLRRLYSELGNDKESVKKLTEKIAPALMDRKSGYTRIIKLVARKGDNAKMARLEWVAVVEEKPKAKKVEKKIAKAKVVKNKGK